MSRRFTHQGLERITVAAGGIASIDGGPVTVITLWKPNSRVASGFITGYNASDAHVWNINPYSDGKLYFGASGFTPTGATYDAGDGWRIDVLTHGTGGGVVTHHSYLFSGGGWSTEVLGTVGDSAAGPCTYYLLGAFDDDEATDGWFGAIAVYTAELDTTAVTTTGIESALANWMALSPGAAWKFNVDDVSSGAVDLTGGGADETSHSATSFSTDEPAGFSYSLGGGRNPGGDFLPFFH